MNKNGTLWYDTDHNPIQAHGGMILFYEGMYYWYGENKNGATQTAPSGDIRVDFIGISCYSSTNCIDWKNEGIVLSASPNPGHDLYKDCVCERPKVIYNTDTKEFVMWMHIDSADYTKARAGVAISASPTGPFLYLYSDIPNRSDCRDMTLVQEPDGKAYLLHSSDWNKTLRISELTADYKGFTGVCTQCFIGQEREAPAVFFKDGLYYMITSGCTGWEPNSALYGVSNALLSGWKLIDNPCEGPHYRQTFFGQSSYVFQKDGEFYLMLDHWKPDDLKNSGYSILPLYADGLMVTVPWTDFYYENGSFVS